MKNDIKTINEIIKVVGESQLTEISIEEKEFKLFIKRPKLTVVSPVVEISQMVEVEEEVVEVFDEIKSKNVGRFFYIDENEVPMITVGMEIKKGQKIGYIEAIGLRTDIKSDFEGEIKEILVKNGELAEFGKILVRVGE
jgi:acetyl-CoA carboxylase biotin carboxyl carrier protein